MPPDPNPRQRESVALRGAKYFGVEGEPRTSIKVGRQEVVIVLKRAPKGRVVVYYSEEYKPEGEYIWLTEKGRVALIEALGGSVDA